MAMQACHFLYLLFLLIFGTGVFFHSSPELIRRSDFPSDFVFGTSTSAFQVEGASREGGKGPSIWDTFTEKHPGFFVYLKNITVCIMNFSNTLIKKMYGRSTDRVKDGSNATVAVDFYHRFKEDVETMKDLGVSAYRFSISWARILPNGKISGSINKEGVEYYNNLINELKSKGLEPFVTLFHWDVPQALEDQYGGFLSPLIVDDFKNYAELCFKLFGDRVKHWMTINEPWSFSLQGYSMGTGAPGRCSPWVDIRCGSGDSGREPYIVAHHQLLAHAAVFKSYRDKYQVSQNGKIGISLICHYFLPYSNSKSDTDAVDRANDFMFGWYLDPLTRGEYPFNMRTIVRDRLPQFSMEQSKMIKGSFDFIGINYYTTHYVKNDFTPWKNNISFEHDTHVSRTGIRNGIPIGPPGASPWLFVYPPGLKEVLLYINNRYNKPVIYITENGVDENNDYNMELEIALKDSVRVDYYKGHLNALREALREGVNVKGYFAWTLFDNFEWADGYTFRFGLYYVDFNSLMRSPKSSAIWLQNFLKS